MSVAGIYSYRTWLFSSAPPGGLREVQEASHQLLAEVSLEKKTSKFGVHVNFGDTPVELPRVGDNWLMKVFEQVGYSGDELRRLNRVRTHHQVLFLLCVLGTSGKLLDKRYLERRQTNVRWSRLDFPNKTPPNKDFTLWRQALKHIVPADGIMDCLGRFNHDSYKM